MHLVFRLTNFHPVLLSPLPFSSVDSLSALGTMTASPDTMLFGSGKKSERSKTKNTMITSKRNSGSQSGVKMKVTHRDPGELRTTQSPLLFFPTQRFRWARRLPSAWSMIPDWRHTVWTCSSHWGILLHPRLLFCTAKFKTFRVDFFLTALI